jgi:hypothetical protein
MKIWQPCRWRRQPDVELDCIGKVCIVGWKGTGHTKRVSVGPPTFRADLEQKITINIFILYWKPILFKL